MRTLLLALFLVPHGRADAAPAPRSLALARDTSGLVASPDGRTAFFVTRITGRSELWRAPSAGGWPLQLTETGPVADPQLSTDGRSLAFMARGGNGRPDLFLIPAEGGEPRNLTDSTSAEAYPRFSPDGRRLAYLSDAPGSAQLFVRDLAEGNARALTSGGGVSAAPAWSPDGRRLACARRGVVLVVDAAKGGVRELETGAERVLSVSWAPKGGMLMALTETEGRRQVVVLHPSWKRPRPAGPLDWDVRKAAWAPAGIVLLRREEAGSSLHLLARPESAPRALTASPEKVEDFALGADGGALLAFLREGPRRLQIVRLRVD